MENAKYSKDIDRHVYFMCILIVQQIFSAAKYVLQGIRKKIL